MKDVEKIQKKMKRYKKRIKKLRRKNRELKEDIDYYMRITRDLRRITGERRAELKSRVELKPPIMTS